MLNRGLDGLQDTKKGRPPNMEKKKTKPKKPLSREEALEAEIAKLTNWALVVGQPSRGDGLSMDSAVVALPNSGLVVRFPITMGLNPDGSSNFEKGTIPDIIVPNTESSLDKVLMMLLKKLDVK